MATGDLVQLIDLSLGSEPCGVVNFNYLHGLLHEIVKRLVQVESFGVPAVGLRAEATREGLQAKAAREGEEKRPGSTSEQGPPGEEKPPVSTSEEETPGGEKRPSEQEPTGEERQVQPSGSGVPRFGSSLRSKPSIVTAANDLGALERKLRELELRMGSMESLPEILERKSSDATATPVRDMWNFTNLNNRMSATEDSLGKTSKLVDDLLGELQGLKSAFDNSLGQMGDRLDQLSDTCSGIGALEKKVEGLKLAAAQDSMGDAAAALLTELQGKIDALESETGNMKQTVESLDPSAYVTTPQLESAMARVVEQQEEGVGALREAQSRQEEAIAAVESSLQECSDGLEELRGKTASTASELSTLVEQIKELEASLAGKVNASDLASLMPQGGGAEEGAALMPKLVEIQNKMAQLEAQLGKQPAIPADFLDKMASMQAAIDKLSAELASLSSLVTSGGDDRARLEDLGSQLAQLRERITELDRAVTALGSAVSLARKSPEAAEEPDSAKYVDSDAFEALQSVLSEMQQEQERVIGTTAHLSHELEINKEHVKSLYSAVDNLRDTKADRELVAVEVGGKADRTALEGKASRDWVDSTFEQLDREIREAKSKLLGQEEAWRNALTQLNEDVEGKLDRMELQPLKEYFDKKLDRVKTAPTIVQKDAAAADDAAGFRKPLRFRCISCDRPVGIKPLGSIPALPSITTFPGNRSFRPYTTYELEIIRKHQKFGFQLPGDFQRAVRSAGGGHTLTRPHQRIRVPPLGSVCTPEPPSYLSGHSSPSVRDEVQIVGHDGHIYKGRAPQRLPPLPRTHGGREMHRRGRPTTSPLQQTIAS